MKKLNVKLEEHIIDHFQYKYNLKPDVSVFCERLAEVVENHFSIPEIKKSGVPKRLMTKWFRITNIKGDMQMHSAYGFAEFLDKHYMIVPLKRNKWYSNILLFILKRI